ncbi:MAG: alpha/beta hydrolase [Betaproteobacteria bacterium]|nr:alpha/beta hydrolase [Betaproteobacteria bacterium]
MPRLNDRIRLDDGRWLGFSESGHPQGAPVFVFHGLPGSRLQQHPNEDIATSLGLRLIGIDRPGFGQSDFNPRRRLLDWPDTVLTLADRLGVGRFRVAGVSGGAPYALACACKFPSRLDGTLIVSGAGPYEAFRNAAMGRTPRLALTLARHTPGLLRPLARWMAQTGRQSPDRYLDRLSHTLAPIDSAILARPDVRGMFRSDLPEAFRGGPQGMIHDLSLLARPWGFGLEEVRADVQLWHGEADTSVPVTVGRYLAAELPRCRARILPTDGHFMVLERWAEILEHWLAA